ncbi:MAG: septal ring lytic transglycosylase RlpA family protein [Halothiobacillaceae bacterium]|nr:septal ring lytic transglycosylase RlpA family protein [Halothiobacillaceae bacterium]
MKLPVLLLFVGTLALLGGCSSTPTGPVEDAVPRKEPYSKYGNPDSYEVHGRRYSVMRNNNGYRERGIASWYGPGFHGKRTSSGETYNQHAMTAAHKTLRIPAYVEVTNLNNGRKTIVRVNDRGPFHDNRVIDLSYAAAQKLGVLGQGTALVEVRHIEPGEPVAPPPAQAGAVPQPVPAAAPVPVPETLPGPRPEWGRNIYIQIGAFSERANAERLRERIAAQVPEVAIVSREGLHRVRVGPLASVEHADSMEARLYGLGIADQHIVID